MKRLFSASAMILAFLLLSSCAPKTAAKTADTPAADAGPRVSFASPEPGATVPFGSIQFLILSEDLRGTAQVEVLVNGVSVGSVSSPDTAKNPVIVEYVWQAPAPGKYVIQAHAQNNAGTWGDFASLELTVAEAGGDTAASPVVETPVIEQTEAPTDVIDAPAASPTSSAPDLVPTATRSGISLEWYFTYMSMYRYGTSCQPQYNSVVVKIIGLSKSEIGGIMVFFRPTEESTGALWNWWTTGLWLELFPSGSYGRGQISTVQMVKRAPGQSLTYWPYIPSIVHYMFAIQDKNGIVIYRSPVYTNLIVKAC